MPTNCPIVHMVIFLFSANLTQTAEIMFCRPGTTKYYVTISLPPVRSREISLSAVRRRKAKMSQAQQSKSSVASRTAFDVLTVESGEESVDEVVFDPEEAVISASSVVCVELSSRFSLHRGSSPCSQRDAS